MPLAQTFYSIRNVRCKLKAGLTPKFTELNIKRNFVFEKKWAGELFVPSQVIHGEDIPEIGGIAYLDANFNWDIVTPNMAVALFDFLSPLDGATQSLLGSDFLLKFPPASMTITLDTLRLDDKLGMCPFAINANVLNPGAFGGMPGYPVSVGGGDAGGG